MVEIRLVAAPAMAPEDTTRGARRVRRPVETAGAATETEAEDGRSVGASRRRALHPVALVEAHDLAPVEARSSSPSSRVAAVAAFLEARDDRASRAKRRPSEDTPAPHLLLDPPDEDPPRRAPTPDAVAADLDAISDALARARAAADLSPAEAPSRLPPATFQRTSTRALHLLRRTVDDSRAVDAHDSLALAARVLDAGRAAFAVSRTALGRPHLDLDLDLPPADAAAEPPDADRTPESTPDASSDGPNAPSDDPRAWNPPSPSPSPSARRPRRFVLPLEAPVPPPTPARETGGDRAIRLFAESAAAAAAAASKSSRDVSTASAFDRLAVVARRVAARAEAAEFSVPDDVGFALRELPVPTAFPRFSAGVAGVAARRAGSVVDRSGSFGYISDTRRLPASARLRMTWRLPAAATTRAVADVDERLATGTGTGIEISPGSERVVDDARDAIRRETLETLRAPISPSFSPSRAPLSSSPVGVAAALDAAAAAEAEEDARLAEAADQAESMAYKVKAAAAAAAAVRTHAAAKDASFSFAFAAGKGNTGARPTLTDRPDRPDRADAARARPRELTLARVDDDGRFDAVETAAARSPESPRDRPWIWGEDRAGLSPTPISPPSPPRFDPDFDFDRDRERERDRDARAFDLDVGVGGGATFVIAGREVPVRDDGRREDAGSVRGYAPAPTSREEPSYPYPYPYPYPSSFAPLPRRAPPPRPRPKRHDRPDGPRGRDDARSFGGASFGGAPSRSPSPSPTRARSPSPSPSPFARRAGPRTPAGALVDAFLEETRLAAKRDRERAARFERERDFARAHDEHPSPTSASPPRRAWRRRGGVGGGGDGSRRGYDALFPPSRGDGAASRPPRDAPLGPSPRPPPPRFGGDGRDENAATVTATTWGRAAPTTAAANATANGAPRWGTPEKLSGMKRKPSAAREVRRASVLCSPAASASASRGREGETTRAREWDAGAESRFGFGFGFNGFGSRLGSSRIGEGFGPRVRDGSRRNGEGLNDFFAVTEGFRYGG